MSAIARLFGKKKGTAPTAQDAIQKLRETEDMLEKKSDYLEKKIGQELASAKKHGTKNKRAALMALKRKKRLEKQLNQIDGTLSTIEFQREALENASANAEVLKNMGYAAKALENAHQQLNVDQVHDLMDDIQEQNELAEEIGQALSQPAGFGQDVDEDELMAELEELEQEDLDEKLLDVAGPASVPLPDVPTAEPQAASSSRVAAKTSDDDDMKELAAWAS